MEEMEKQQYIQIVNSDKNNVEYLIKLNATQIKKIPDKLSDKPAVFINLKRGDSIKTEKTRRIIKYRYGKESIYMKSNKSKYTLYGCDAEFYVFVFEDLKDKYINCFKDYILFYKIIFQCVDSKLYVMKKNDFNEAINFYC